MFMFFPIFHTLENIEDIKEYVAKQSFKKQNAS